jgi:8-oxo-dGTP pyrophosphatase MutT (NUDIX family)
LSDDGKKGAGILFAHRDSSGESYVLLGDKKRTRLTESLGRWGICDHGWALPFGRLDEEDCNAAGGATEAAFRRCAIREAAEEVGGVREQPGNYDESVERLTALAGEPIEQLLAAHDGYRFGGTLVGGALRAAGVEYWTYLVHVHQRFAATDSWQFNTGSWTWYPVADVPNLSPQHTMLKPTLRHFKLWRK